MSAFLSYLVSGVAVGCGFALIGSGLVIIHRVTRVVNLSQGMYAVVAALSATTFLAAGLPHGVAELCAVLVSVVAGLLTGLVAIGRRGTTPLSSLIITFAVGIFAYAVEVLTWGDQPRSFPGLPGAIESQACGCRSNTSSSSSPAPPFFSRSTCFSSAPTSARR